MSKAFRLSKVEPDVALASVLKYKEFLALIFIIQIIVAIWSATFYGQIITVPVASLYIIMWVGMLAVFGLAVKDLDHPAIPPSIAPRSWLSRTFRYGLFMLVGLGIFGAMAYAGYVPQGTVFQPYAWSIFIFTVVIVAPSETIAFQGILPNRIRAWIRRQNSVMLRDLETPIVYIGSQALFSVGHYATYGGSAYLLLGAFVFGCVFLWVAETWGLASAMGLHSAWNLTVIGVIGGITINQMITPSSAIIIGTIIAILLTFAIAYKLAKSGIKTWAKPKGSVS